MKIAIYSRKSKFTIKGDSIENQIEMCKTYIKNHIKDPTEFLIYNDDGFSGKNLNRPKFKQMLNDAKNKKFSVIICYRLDRVSRNICDFSSLINTLQYLNINFISIKEQFDTTTPMGRAMMYIASIFAQLERETIAERISDNMLELAKAGRWLGGQTPLGFNSTAICYLDNEMHEKKMYSLSPIKEELEIVKLVYKNYIEYHSLSKVTKYLIQNSIKTKTGKLLWNKQAVRDILTNPVYVRANKNVMIFLKKQGINIIGDPDNKHGILTYNKKRGTKKFRKTNEWIAAIAKHEGIIDGKKWLEVQEFILKNKHKAPRIGKTSYALLTGLLNCKHCGSPMKIIHGPLDKNGKKLFYYKCSKKDYKGENKCFNPNIRTDEIEMSVINELRKIPLDKETIVNTFINFNNYNKNIEIRNIKHTISNKQAQVKNLIKYLSVSSELSNDILSEIKILKTDIKKLKCNLEQMYKRTDLEYKNIDNIKKLLGEILVDNFFNIEEKKLILRSIIDYITWDGETGTVDIHLVVD
ncbi:recombinase family protein [Clostridium felsineum]|uniref:recombinase family protein n=1 Tax=Clostridium felsineum TaxID=36839 RepID=UPI00098C1EFD|nr:recombinase family protein [Clostridium felsineum]MCR3761458.1 recombinase family protein [Clostridium felsineum]URZ00653.1 hypothetical protein CLAUR_006410 [Clostridium felsineum]